jgi:hypothetical protein
MFKAVIGFVFAGALMINAMGAEVFIRLAPPRVVVEHRDARPSVNHVWISGYNRYENDSYVWTPGRWEQRPHPHARWVDGRWSHHKKSGWVYTEGRWR